MTRILHHRTLAAVPPPIAPARLRPERLAFDDAHTGVRPEATDAPRRQAAAALASPHQPPVEVGGGGGGANVLRLTAASAPIPRSRT